MLFMFFTLLFIIFNMLNYYLFYYQSKTSMKTSLQKKINWKW
uniref:ATP synthase F0 subunit 8 n=1 Tax=Ceratocanthus sp. CER01 TaxID=1205613 RepID=A0A0S2MPK1_9SCAR|nr:ATP synthase F0 subunit 8 [Ceratocanthus sp. CER01]